MLLPATASATHSLRVLRRVSIICLLFAWFCTNGVVCNVVQLVAWAKMFQENAQMTSNATALDAALNGSKPCKLCHLVQAAQSSTHEQSPNEADHDSTVKTFLAIHFATPLVLNAPDTDWPGVVHDTGLTRTQPASLRPPRV